MSTERFFRLASLILAYSYFIMFTVQYAAIFDYFIPEITRYSRVIQAVIVIISLIIGIIRGRLVVLIAAALFSVMIAYHIRFITISSMPYNFNALFTYVPLFAFVPIVVAQLSSTQILRVLFFVSVSYVTVYVFANGALIDASRASADTIGGILDSGDYRGARVFLAALSASYVAFYAYEDREMPLPLRILAIALALAAIILGNSRTFGAIFVLLSLIRVFRLNSRPIMTAAAAGFLLVSSLHLYGLFDKSWNPYSLFASDISARGRYLEYPLAIEAIKEHWLFGVGIEPDGDAMAVYLHVPRRWGTVFFNDLGAIGPLGAFGIPGLLLFFVASILCIMSAAERSTSSGINALRLNCALSGLFGIIAPTVLWPAASFFTATLFGVWLRGRFARQVLEEGRRQEHRQAFDTDPAAMQGKA